MAARVKWTEEKIAAFEKEGRGQGAGKNYIPWLNRLSFSSSGRCRSTGTSSKTGRGHEFFSDVEYSFFLCLERDECVVDIREQFPLNREITLEVARTLGIPHPTYPVTKVQTVMTVDFLVTKIVDGEEVFVGYDTKVESAVEDARTVAKLEIQRETLALMGYEHYIVLDTTIPKPLVNKLEWIRRSPVEAAEVTPYPGYWDEVQTQFLVEFGRAPMSSSLTEFCVKLDQTKGFEPGASMTAARTLMFLRRLEPDMTARTIQDSKISQFAIPKISRAFNHLREVG